MDRTAGARWGNQEEPNDPSICFWIDPPRCPDCGGHSDNRDGPVVGSEILTTRLCPTLTLIKGTERLGNMNQRLFVEYTIGAAGVTTLAVYGLSNVVGPDYPLLMFLLFTSGIFIAYIGQSVRNPRASVEAEVKTGRAFAARQESRFSDSSGAKAAKEYDDSLRNISSNAKQTGQKLAYYGAGLMVLPIVFVLGLTIVS